jgi:predicted MPP superfamily phosphohydrolase
MWPLRYLVPLQQPMVDGLETVAGTPVVTSRGVGAWGPAIRVLARPEVPIVTLRRS